MSQRKLIVCNPAIFFENNAPAVYPWLLEKLGRGDEARALQAKYEEGKAVGPSMLPEMAELFKGVESIDLICRQYCWEFGRREVFEIFRRFNERGHRCMLVTSLPKEICTEFADLTRMICVDGMFVASRVLGNSKYEPILLNRESRKEMALGLIEIILEPQSHPAFAVNYHDVLVVGNSLTDIPLGRAVQEKCGRFVAFHPKDTDIMKVADHTYGDVCTLEKAFQLERLFVN